MKFKQFLSESYNFKGIEELISDARLPITTKISKILEYGVKHSTVYHCTTKEHISSIKKIQGTKKHISTFTKGLANLLDKIIVKPDVMFVLDGTSVMNFDHDIFSQPDK